jgi:quercetin dioxygenase-like cupin family protein
VTEARADRAATQVVAPGDGRALWLATDLHVLKAVGEETGGVFALSEVTVQPQFAPPPHVHRREDESFYVLEGEFEFMLDGDTFTCGPGSFVHLPKGRLHMHRAAGGRPAKALVLVTPAGVEGFIEEAGEPATDKSAVPPVPEMEEIGRIVEIAGRYGIEVPPPPEQG